MHGYRPIFGTTGMWEHKTRQTKFCVCVDDFGINYFNKDNTEHLLGCLQKNSRVPQICKKEITVDWHLIGITMKITSMMQCQNMCKNAWYGWGINHKSFHSTPRTRTRLWDLGKREHDNFHFPRQFTSTISKRQKAYSVNNRMVSLLRTGDRQHYTSGPQWNYKCTKSTNRANKG